MNKLEEFVLSYPAKTTQRSYKSHLTDYFRTIDADPETYFDEKRDYVKDFTEFWMALQDKSPCTRMMRMSCVKTFLEENDINIPIKVWKKLRRKNKSMRPVTIDVVPTNKELKKILQYAEIKARSLFLIASSSGMRIDEILKLTKKDIPALEKAKNGEPYDKPVRIYIRAETTKNKTSRTTFMSDEAFESLLAWMKERGEWLKLSVKKVRGLCKKDVNDPTIFCFQYSNAHKIWHRLLRKAGFNERDQTTNFHRMHIHVLRKFFETRMSYAGIPTAVYEQLEGHEGYLNGAYKRYTVGELAEAYKKGMPALLVFESAPDISDVHERLREKDLEIKDLKTRLEEMEKKFGNFTLGLIAEEVQKLKDKK